MASAAVLFRSFCELPLPGNSFPKKRTRSLPLLGTRRLAVKNLGRRVIVKAKYLKSGWKSGVKHRAIKIAACALLPATWISITEAVIAGPREQVRNQIINQAQVLDKFLPGEGIQATFVNYYEASVNHGGVTNLRLSTYPNKAYAIITGCDNDCSDLDVEVHDNQERVVAKDNNDNDHPVAVFASDYGRDYHIQLQMYSCSRNPCVAGAALFELTRP
jgi:hypothetical protein